MSAGMTDHLCTNDSPPANSNTNTSALSAMIHAVTMGSCVGRREASVSGISIISPPRIQPLRGWARSPSWLAACHAPTCVVLLSVGRNLCHSLSANRLPLSTNSNGALQHGQAASYRPARYVAREKSDHMSCGLPHSENLVIYSGPRLDR